MLHQKLILLVSGKRKCGKDYLSEKIMAKIGVDKCLIVRISEPIKSHFARTKELNLEELMSENEYKERYRVEMILWSDEVREREPGYFCKAACEKAEMKPLWIVSDIRRKTDIEWFKQNYGEKVKIIRITAGDEVRKQRGWVFTEGVDDVTSECDLDDFLDWNLVISNNNIESYEKGFNEIIQLIKTYNM